VEALKAKDLQIQSLQQHLFTKTSDYIAEKKSGQEATAAAREAKLGYSRLENELKKLQSKYEELVKEKVLPRLKMS
jgi:lambda repressor-like predicted transcriptional regulator